LNIVVTGGAGFIGSHLVDRLINEYNSVIVLDNFYLGRKSNLKDAIKNGVEVIDLDVSDLVSVRNFFSWRNVDVIFNLAVVPLLASLEDPFFAVTQNILITTIMCEMIRKGLANTLVQFSSSGVYGSQNEKMIENVTHRIPVTPYDASKLASEEIVFSYCRTFDIDALVIRPFNTYGPRQNSGNYAGVIPSVINKMLKNQPVVIYGNGEQTRDFIYVSDVVDISIKAFETSDMRGKVINAGTENKCSINYLIDMLVDIIGYDRSMISNVEDRQGEISNRQSDNRLMNSLLRISSKVDLYSGLQKTVDWYRSELS
jgi:UDP-glucose 4-epimerase